MRVIKNNKTMADAIRRLKDSVKYWFESVWMTLKGDYPVVHQMRSGAPDKICLWHQPTHDLVMHDGMNLRDFSLSQLRSMLEDPNAYILPADEGDIKMLNEVTQPLPMDRILLPQTHEARIINYYNTVPKDSYAYMNLFKNTGIEYPALKTYMLTEFCDIYSNPDMRAQLNGKAVKVTAGSGSRGIWLIDSERAQKLGGKYVSEFTEMHLDDVLQYATENDGCDIIVQDLAPDNLLKCNVDFVIKDGKLLTYKWDMVNQSQQFTNWDSAHIVCNEYTDMIMNKVVEYLVKDPVINIENAIMNFECFSDLESRTVMIEFNWRYSNPMFEYQAFGTDILSIYFRNQNFPLHAWDGSRISRYWQCTQYSDIIGYNYKK